MSKVIVYKTSPNIFRVILQFCLLVSIVFLFYKLPENYIVIAIIITILSSLFFVFSINKIIVYESYFEYSEAVLFVIRRKIKRFNFTDLKSLSLKEGERVYGTAGIPIIPFRDPSLITIERQDGTQFTIKYYCFFLIDIRNAVSHIKKKINYCLL